jgi:hypothetical protein
MSDYAKPVYLSEKPEVGETALSAVIVDGNVFIVDQRGKMLKGLVSCSVKTEVDAITMIELSCYAHKGDS